VAYLPAVHRGCCRHDGWIARILRRSRVQAARPRSRTWTTPIIFAWIRRPIWLYLGYGDGRASESLSRGRSSTWGDVKAPRPSRILQNRGWRQRGSSSTSRAHSRGPGRRFGTAAPSSTTSPWAGAFLPETIRCTSMRTHHRLFRGACGWPAALARVRHELPARKLFRLGLAWGTRTISSTTRSGRGFYVHRGRGPSSTSSTPALQGATPCKPHIATRSGARTGLWSGRFSVSCSSRGPGSISGEESRDPCARRRRWQVARAASRRQARWLLLIHQIPPQAPNYLRVKIGRRAFRKIGAAAVKNSVYALPNTDESQEQFTWVARGKSPTPGRANSSILRVWTSSGIAPTMASSSYSMPPGAAGFEAAGETGPGPEEGALGRKAATRREGPGPRLEGALTRLRKQLADLVVIDFFSGSPVASPWRRSSPRWKARPRIPAYDDDARARHRAATSGPACGFTRKGIHVDRMG